MDRRSEALKYFDENEEFMKSTVEANIEKYRKGNAFLTVTDSNGAPVKGAKIKLRQKTHEFKYGANIFMLDELESEEKNEKYKESFKEIFNIATVPFYWSDLEPERGKPRYAADSPKIYRRPPTDLCVDFCLQNGIEPKCHCLNYINFTPTWLREASFEEFKVALEKRMKEISERYAEKIPSFEVTNETLKPFEGAITKPKYFLEDDFTEWSYECAEKYFPNNELIINDCFALDGDGFMATRSAYYMQIEKLLREGAHIDTIGIQYHSHFMQDKEASMASTRYNPLHIYRILDLYARFGKNIQITEMTIPAYSYGEEDEAVQAELIEKLYTVFFSHPAMSSLLYWNLVDGYAAFAPQGDMTSGENKFYGGFLRFDFTKKPAYEVVKNLFSKRWHTECEVTTDELGRANFRGFYGNYDILIKLDGRSVSKEISLSKKSDGSFGITI